MNIIFLFYRGRDLLGGTCENGLNSYSRARIHSNLNNKLVNTKTRANWFAGVAANNGPPRTTFMEIRNYSNLLWGEKFWNNIGPDLWNFWVPLYVKCLKLNLHKVKRRLKLVGCASCMSYTMLFRVLQSFLLIYGGEWTVAQAAVRRCWVFRFARKCNSLWDRWGVWCVSCALAAMLLRVIHFYFYWNLKTH
jgi:hypothetical protein